MLMLYCPIINLSMKKYTTAIRADQRLFVANISIEAIVASNEKITVEASEERVIIGARVASEEKVTIEARVARDENFNSLTTLSLT